jgi:serine/threonine-protein kinase
MSSIPPIGEGTVINSRYEIRKKLGSGGMGEVYLAFDRIVQQAVALKIVRDDAKMPGDEEAMRQEAVLARSVGHPNVCRVHDLALSEFGPIIVMEYIRGETLHVHIRKSRAQGGFKHDEFRKIASEVAAGLSAIHREGLVHGDLKPGNVMVTEEKAVILDFGFAQERARLSARRSGAPPDGGTPNYMSPERLNSGGAGQEDDIYALGLTLWEMWTCRVPEPGGKPRQKTMKTQLMFDVPSGLSTDEIKQIYRCLSEDPAMRPVARHLKFFNPTTLTTSPIAVPRERLDPGPPLGRAAAQQFVPGAQGLLVTYASNATESVGQLFPLMQPTLQFGRRPDQDIVVPEATVSGAHALMRWQGGQWIVEDRGSTNGTYAEFSYERKQQVMLLHGGEVQTGELRLKLVSFQPESPQHKMARAFLAKRDGLTGLLSRTYMLRALADEQSFADWSDVNMAVARYELRGPNRLVSERPTILEMLALRKAAKAVVEQTEHLLLSLSPVVAGRTGPLRWAVAMVGHSMEEARQVVEQVAAQVAQSLPDSIELVVTIIKAEPGRPVRTLIE